MTSSTIIGEPDPRDLALLDATEQTLAAGIAEVVPFDPARAERKLSSTHARSHRRPGG